MNIRLCSYNIEWFNHLFNKDNPLKTGSKEQKRLKAIGDSPFKIWNPYLDEKNHPIKAKPLKQELTLASDHFPVTLDLEG